MNDDNKPIVSIVVDNDTGEIIKEIHEGDLVKIFSKEQLEHLRKYKVINKNNHFVKTIGKPSSMLALEGMKASEYDIIFAMLNNIGFEVFSGYLIKVQCNMFCGFLNEKDLQAKTNLCKKTFLTSLKRLEQRKIIAIEQDEKDKRSNRILVNPFIFMCGQEITTHLYEKFKNTKWNYLGQ